ncbi:MAG: ADOP family duplicated permease, partial [Vicinamibacteria bacterium]|nr:ADOP family duplicated permease [Vicinamibacteria bacterium]
MKFGARQLWRRPAFTAVAVASLALGIGLNTTLFSVVNAVLFRESAVVEPERLVEIYTGVNDDLPQFTTSYPDYQDIRASVPAFEAVAAHGFVRGIVSSGSAPALATGETVSANYFDVLKVAPTIGRGFLAEDDASSGARPVVVLSHGLWQRRFAGREGVLGETLELSGTKYDVVGIAPATFQGTLPGLSPEFWVPIAMVDRLNFMGAQATTDKDPGTTRLERRGTRWLFLKGRLAEGQTLEQARAQVETLYARLRTEYPDTNDKARPSLKPAADVRFHPMLDGYVKAASAVLLSAVGLVLVVACANVANMLLARGASRRRELALRVAIGASRGRLVRQMLAESLVLAALGGAAGLAIAHFSGQALNRLPMDDLPLPLHFDFSPDWRVLAFAAAASLVTTVLFGLVPALSASKPDLVPSLKADATGEGSVRRRFALRDALVVGQLALSLVLLVAGALLVRGLDKARGTDLGFEPDRVASLGFNLGMNGYDAERATALRPRILEALRAVPGVESVALATRLPLAPDVNLESVRIQGQHQPDDDGTPVDVVEIGPDYFAAVGVPLVEGRIFDESDLAAKRKVAIVNQTFARRYFAQGGALGQRVYLSGFDQDPHEIVGVTRDHKVRSVGEEPRPYLHLPMEPSRSVGLVARAKGPAATLLPALRAAVLAVEPAIVFTEATTATEVAATTV